MIDDKLLQRLYSDYHFKRKCINKRTYATLPVHSYIDYTDNKNCVNNDKDGDIDFNRTLIQLKDNMKENLKEYIRTNLKLEIINELKLEIENEIKKNLKIK